MIDIDISEALKRPGTEFAYEFNDAPVLQGISLEKPLAIRARYVLEDNVVRVTGSVRTQVGEKCSRCLEGAHVKVQEEFDEVFTDKGENDAYTFSAAQGRLSLDGLVRDLLLTAVPIQVLCRPDCKGLCPECGANLNETTCGCSSQISSTENNVTQNESPFAVLKDLFE